MAHQQPDGALRRRYTEGAWTRQDVVCSLSGAPARRESGMSFSSQRDTHTCASPHSANQPTILPAFVALRRRYIDKRGFHCISHRFSIVGDPICTEPGGCTVFDAARDGGHSFSPHGWGDTWYCADGHGGHAHCTPDQPPAYNATIVYEQGGVHKFGTRERPHVLFDGDTPVALTNSVQHCQAPGIPDACVPGNPLSCNESNKGCHNQWPGYQDRSWTAIAPLRTAKQSH